MSGHRLAGFALPTVLIAAVVLLMVLVTAVSATVAIRSSLKDNDQMKLAALASEAGVAFAKACLADSNNKVTWSDQKPLKPNTDCSGNIRSGASEFVIESDELRTYFVVNQPIASNITAKGYVEILRASSGDTWKIFTSDKVYAQSASDNNPVGTSLDGYWTSPPPGYLLEDGSCISQTTYADLYTVIGNNFGSCSGSDFKLPDSRGRVGVNKSTENQFDTLGEVGGATSHTHALSESGWARIGFTGTGSTGEYFGVDHVTTPTSWSADLRLVGSNGNGSSTGTNYTRGAGLDGETDVQSSLQPYITVMRVIKY